MLKKIWALILAVMMTAAVGAAFAAEGDLTGDGIVGNFTSPDTPNFDGKTVIMYKEITAYNPETCTVNAPTITYEYTIEAGDANKDIYDVKTAHDPEANAHAKTKAGVGSPTISGSVDGTTYVSGKLQFTPDVQFNASTAGTANKYNLKVDFSSVDFTTAGSGAGVYRYVITETPNEATKNAAGIEDGTISDKRYLDVYVDGNGKVYGYVCFAYNNNIDARDDATTDTVAEAYKTEGFTAGTDTNTEEAVTADAYYTFNLEVSKEVENDEYAVNTKHEFPFSITLANTAVTADVLPIMTIDGKAHQNALSAGPIAGTWAPTIADGAVISYVGIPCGTTVTIYETNDVAGVTYVSVSEGADTDAETKNIDTDTASNSAVINCTTHITAANHNHTGDNAKVVFTNTLLTISPTGVVLRVAPYILILAAGIALLLISRKRRSSTREN